MTASYPTVYLYHVAAKFFYTKARVGIGYVAPVIRYKLRR